MKHLITLAVTTALLLPAIVNGTPRAESIAKGKQLSFDGSKGNCLACHLIADGEMAGNLGPPLIQMKQRYPKRSVLKAKLTDATASNPQTLMPPFGKHGILSNEELEQVVDYLYTL